MRKSKRSEKKQENFELIESSGNVFADLGFGAESASMLMRADLMSAIIDIIDEHGWKAAEAASQLGVKESRISELRQGHVTKFSVDLLLKYLARLGKHVDFSIRHEVA